MLSRTRQSQSSTRYKPTGGQSYQSSSYQQQRGRSQQRKQSSGTRQQQDYSKREKRGTSRNVFDGKRALFLKLGRGANQYNVEKNMRLFEDFGGQAFSEDSFWGDQDSKKLLRQIDYIVMWDHDLAVDIRKIAQLINVSDKDLMQMIDQIDVISYMWINDCVKSGKIKDTQKYEQDIDTTRVYYGGEFEEQTRRKRRSSADFNQQYGKGIEQQKAKRSNLDDQREEEDEEEEWVEDQDEGQNEETALTEKQVKFEDKKPTQSQSQYRKQYDPTREEDPNAPGLRGSNYFVKKTPHGHIRRHEPDEENEEGQEETQRESIQEQQQQESLVENKEEEELGEGENQKQPSQQQEESKENLQDIPSAQNFDLPKQQEKQENPEEQQQQEKTQKKDRGLSKEELLDTLQKIADDMQAKKDTGHMVAYKRAITRVQDHEADINSLDDLDHIFGIGPTIKRQLKEYFQAGQVSDLSQSQSQKSSTRK